MGIKDVYNINKLFHHKKALVGIANREIVSPVNFQIDLTNKCNNKCVWCFYDIHPLPEFSRKDSLDLSILKDTLVDFKAIGGRSVEWTGGGEPTIYPHFCEIVDFTKRLGLRQAMVTNGKKLSGEIAKKAKDFDWVRISLNSASDKTYKQQHGNNSFGNVITNISNFAKLKSSNCVLGVSMIVDGNNYHEISDMTALSKTLGANNSRISLPQTPEDDKMFEGIWDKVLEEMKLAKCYEDESFAVFTNENRIETLARKTESNRCYYHHITPSLGANGAVYPCCHFKYLPEFNLGNVNETSLEMIWCGGKRKAFIDTVGECCKTSCWMNGKNTLADYIVKEPKDVPHLDYP